MAKKFRIYLEACIEFEAEAETKEEATAAFFEELSYTGDLMNAEYDIKEVGEE